MSEPSEPVPNPLRDRFAPLARLLAGRRATWVAVLAGTLLVLPSLGTGFALDDYYHRAVLLGRSRFRGLFGAPDEMFRFFRGDPVRTRAEMDVGVLPWWTYPGIKAEFLQALTVLTHRLDYALWPNRPWLMHAQSIAWYAALVAVTACLYRRLFGPSWQAGLAALLFAIDDAHGAPAGWLANRNSVVAAFFGVSALIAHDRWRREGWRLGGVMGPVLLAAALLAKEEGIATCAYLFAYAAFLEPSGRSRGLATLLPYAAVVVVWRTLRAYGGYGVANVGLYIDPITDPGRFLVALVERFPLYLLGQWSFIPADIAAIVGPRARSVLWWIALIFLALLGLTLLPLLRRDRLARFWTIGMLLAVVPVCATIPMDRLLIGVGIGAFGLMARFLALVLGHAGPPPVRFLRRLPAIMMASAFMCWHLVLAPLALPFRALSPFGFKSVEERFYVKTPFDASVEGQSVVLVNPPSILHTFFLPIRRELDGLPVPRHTRVLATGIHDVTIFRADRSSLTVRPADGFLFLPPDQLFRNEQHPLVLGQRVELSGMTAVVEEISRDGRVLAVRFEFGVPLEDRSLRWLRYRQDSFEPLVLPAVGQVLRLEGVFSSRVKAQGSETLQ